MTLCRTSTHADLPRLRELWALAFGDGTDYIDHFFTRYWQPERMLVLEQEGQVLAMTAWFDMPYVRADGQSFPAAYLYAVATHPDCRGRGLAGRLLGWTEGWLKGRGFVCLTTVPARPDLHPFFAQNGFEEHFVLEQGEYAAPPAGEGEALRPLTPGEYGRLRETLLAGADHIACSPAALDYQAGCCRLSGGGLFGWEGGCLCAERADEDTVVVKELLGGDDVSAVLARLAGAVTAKRILVRRPLGEGEPWPFAMVRWLGEKPDTAREAYLGLAFD